MSGEVDEPFPRPSTGQFDAWDGPRGRAREAIWIALRDLAGGTDSAALPGFWYDACTLAQHDGGLASSSHLIGHCLRELDSLLRALLLTPVGEGSAESEPTDHGEGGAVVEPDAETKRAEQILAIGASFDLDPVLCDAWKRLQLHRVAHRSAQSVRPRGDALCALESMTDVLEGLLPRVNDRYTSWLRLIDKHVVGQAPTQALSSILAAVPMNYGTVSYLLDALHDPDWFEPLRKRGLLEVAEPVVDSVSGGSSYRAWSAAGFLKRIAIARQREVAEFLSTVDLRQNGFAYQTVLEVGCLLDAASARRVAERFERAPTEIGPTVVWFEIGRFVGHLALVGATDSAVSLARRVLHIEWPTNSAVWSLRQGTGWLDDYSHAQVGQACVQALTGREDSLRLLDVLIELLPPLVPDGFGDFSGPWCPDLERESSDRSILESVVLLIRDSARSYISDGGDLNVVVRRLEDGGRTVLKRLAAHLLAGDSSGNPSLATARLTSAAFVHDVECQREVAEVARRYLPTLSAEAARAFTNLVREGPPYEQVDDPEVIERYVSYWRALISRPLVDVAGDSVGEYRGWADAHPDADVFRPRFQIHSSAGSSGSWGNGTSPLTEDELRNMPPGDLATMLKSWVPESEFGSPTIGGLATVLTMAIAADPGRYCAALDAFADVPEAFRVALWRGLIAAVAADATIDWVAVLRFARAQLADLGQPVDVGLRHVVVDIISSGLQSPNHSIPATEARSVRETLMDLVRPGAPDDEPGGEDSDRYAESTVESKALGALTQMLWWTAPSDSDTVLTSAQRRDLVADLATLVGQSRSPAAKAAVAAYLPWLVHVDADINSLIEALNFGDADDSRGAETAWRAYLRQEPRAPAMRRLRSSYIASFQRSERTATDAHEYEQRLAEHVICGYWWGLWSLDDLDRLVESYFDTAGSAARTYALAWTGDQLGKAPDVDADTVHRLEALWNAVTSSESLACSTERGAFSTWFASGRLDDAWALPELLRVLQSGSALWDQRAAIQALRALRSRRVDLDCPLIDALEQIVATPKNPWLVSAVEDDISVLLTALSTSSDPGVVQTALRLANRLVSQGWKQFRPIVEPPEAVAPSPSTTAATEQPEGD